MVKRVLIPPTTPDVVTRFAPSPTGALHLGHAYSATLAHDRARSHGGRFVLRIEDIDRDRCRPDYVAGIFDDLRWLGLDWDAVVVQSERRAAHDAALERLHAMGLLYPCTCTRAEIAASASAPQGVAGPVYPGTCRPPRHSGLREGDHGKVAWRLDVERAADVTGSLHWDDADVGTITADPLSGGDVVLARKGLGVAYHLAVVVDDAEADVTDVVRGVDLFAATHVQRLLQALLGLPTPRYAHHRLVAGPDGKRLAKRARSATLAELRVAGTDPATLVKDLRAHRLPVGFGWAGA